MLRTPGYKFPTAPPYGIQITGSDTSEFYDYTRVSDTEVDVTDGNNDGQTHYYTVTVIDNATGASVTVDPTIRDRQT